MLGNWLNEPRPRRFYDKGEIRLHKWKILLDRSMQASKSLFSHLIVA
jgi:hypothetical protein